MGAGVQAVAPNALCLRQERRNGAALALVIPRVSPESSKQEVWVMPVKRAGGGKGLVFLLPHQRQLQGRLLAPGLKHTDDHESAQGQQLRHRQCEPEKRRCPGLGPEQGVEGVPHRERRARQQHARTERGQWVPSAEEHAQADAHRWDKQRESQGSPAGERAPARQESCHRARREQNQQLGHNAPLAA